MDWKRGLGFSLGVIGALIAVGVGLWFTKDANCLWALIPVALIASNLRSNANNHVTAGVVVFAACALVSLALYLTLNASVLWALLLVALLVDNLT